MIGMAKHGHGSSYYGQTVDDLMDPFREEFELLNALCARGVRLEAQVQRRERHHALAGRARAAHSDCGFRSV